MTITSVEVYENACHAAADESGERWGVWAGVDRTPPKQIRPGRWPR
ncbi:MAG: hypothetical protein QM286_03760 [Acidobacteriota bacterium]|nr:hypothetical protein [Acidobacteriota bacterium]